MRVAVLLGLVGCTHRPPEPATDPGVAFRQGVEALQDDRRRGVDHDAAYASFVASVALGGGSRAMYDAGWVAERLGRLGDAERHYRDALAADPSYALAADALAQVLRATGRPEEAIGLHAAADDRLLAMVEARHDDDALALAREMLRQDPAQAEVYRALSALHRARGERGLAVLTARKALEIDPADAGTLNDLGLLAFDEGQTSAALTSFRAALAIEPEQFAANMNLGALALHAGDWERARACFGRALAARPDEPEAQAGLAEAGRALAARQPKRARPEPVPDSNALPALAAALAELREHPPACDEAARGELDVLLEQGQQVLDAADADLAVDVRALLEDAAAACAR